MGRELELQSSYTYLDKLICSDGWQSFALRVEEAAGRMCRISGRDPINHTLRLCGPVGGGERKSIVCARVQRVHLDGHAVDPTAADA